MVFCWSACYCIWMPHMKLHIIVLEKYTLHSGIEPLASNVKSLLQANTPQHMLVSDAQKAFGSVSKCMVLTGYELWYSSFMKELLQCDWLIYLSRPFLFMATEKIWNAINGSFFYFWSRQCWKLNLVICFNVFYGEWRFTSLQVFFSRTVECSTARSFADVTGPWPYP